MAWNRNTLELYPHGIGQDFPAFLTHRSGVDCLLLGMMRPLFDKGLRPGALADTILELHAKRYHQECLKHEWGLAKTGNVHQKPMLSEFGDKTKYNGLVPNGRYLMHVYKTFHSTIKDFLDNKVKKRGAKFVSVDASYKEPKHLCQYHGQNLFKGLITITNEIGEIRMQFHVVTDDHEQFRPSLLAFLNAVKSYGQHDLELVFTANVHADRHFYLDTFPSLLEAQGRLDIMVTDRTMPNENDINKENTCTVDDTQIRVLSSKGAINEFITALKENIQGKPPEDRVIGLDAEWNVLTASHGMGMRTGKLALLILAYKDSGGRQMAALLRLHKLSSLPDRMLHFLVGGTKFVGNHVGGDIRRLGRDYKCEDEMMKVLIVNLGQYARERDVVQSGTVRLDVLVQICLKETMKKQTAVRVSSKWEDPSLSQDQKQYAALDGIKSLEVYLYLREKPDLSLRLSEKEAKVGLCVDIAPLRGGPTSMVATRCGSATLTEQSFREWEVPSVPYVKKESGEPVCLADFGAPPFLVILPLTMLKQHIESDDIQTFPNMNDDTGTTRTTTPPAPPQSPRTVQHQVINQDDTSTEEEDSTGPTGMDLLDNNADAEAVHLSNDDVTLLRKVCLLGKEAALRHNLLTCAHLEPAPTPDTINDWFSAVVGDAFHVMD
ncbi:unnamed protein product [Cylindrotheca closterium]|uniref:3'-5' exonuclease domain-containing protein n=1 Tax=Cylindrotheca closterium TaxID=2856 RepID=A0AAD2G775_9STRA|nr:unnamed protein product [Cylindrotheca closterium]